MGVLFHKMERFGKYDCRRACQDSYQAAVTAIISEFNHHFSRDNVERV